MPIDLKALYSVGKYEELATLANEESEKYSCLERNYIGAALLRLNRWGEATDFLKAAASVCPDNSSLISNYALSQRRVGNHVEALKLYSRARSMDPDNVEIIISHIDCMAECGLRNEAIEVCALAVYEKPNATALKHKLAALYFQTGDFKSAAAIYDKSIIDDPSDAAMLKAAICYVKLKDVSRAFVYLSMIEESLKNSPEYLTYAASLFQRHGYLERAAKLYEILLQIAPESFDANLNYGANLHKRFDLHGAEKYMEKAVRLSPSQAIAHYNFAVLLNQIGKKEKAIRHYEAALEIDPTIGGARPALYHLKRSICLWDDSENEIVKIDANSALSSYTCPFSLLTLEDDPEKQLLRSKKNAARVFNGCPSQDYINAKLVPSRKIRVGFLGADFHAHATYFLISGVFKCYSRDRFEFFVFSYGPSIECSEREHIRRHCDAFFDVNGKTDGEIQDLCRRHQLDIAIDLKGYTTYSRVGIFSCRLAPVHISFLGYPGSLGSPCIDYIIADDTVISTDTRNSYSEKIIFLPNSYQPNDNSRSISLNRQTRDDFGLPKSGLVLCCFNSPYKIGRAEFSIWMNLLKKIDNAVLWLINDSALAERNLRAEARMLGIDQARLVFAEKMAHSEHLARHIHADLFVDTFNVNAHTTASDALWSGLPIVTMKGRQFSARVAASLLKAVGLSELITHSPEEYEDLIYKLATDPPRLRVVKDKLRKNLLVEPLFDTVSYTLNFERGLRIAFERYSSGKLPDDIWVERDEV